MAALFALDQNFPEPIVNALNDFIPEVELVPVREIEALLAELDDWEVLLALHHHERSSDPEPPARDGGAAADESLPRRRPVGRSRSDTRNRPPLHAFGIHRARDFGRRIADLEAR